MNGGYYMIDCTGLDLTKGLTEQTITGIYAKCKRALAMDKPVVAYNCSWGDLPVTPIQVFGIQISSTRIIMTSSTLQIIVDSTDVITINNMVES